MKTPLRALILLLLLLSITGCSRKNNTFVNRNWHAITAEYNTLYNGNLALELGKQELNQNYVDDYWNILPVERMQVREEIVLPGTSRNPNFAIAEEKAVKAIQRHSMLIEGKEKNPQVDEAYLLLGKARYFDQRFVPALEAFNYILHRYPLSNTINEARIWRAKANIRLEFTELALNNLKDILEQKQLENQDRADAAAMLAQAHIELGSLEDAVTALDTAAHYTKNESEKGRYIFIQGQLYNRLDKKEQANEAFAQVVDLKRQSPRIYLINAHIKRIQNVEINPDNRSVVLEQLKKLERDRENRPFLDCIFFQLAEFHYQNDSIALAEDYYNRSLATSEDDYLQSLSYETLGNIYFDRANYKSAGAYYDSTLTKLSENSRELRLIKKKRDNLEDVIYYENVAQVNDSILYVVALAKEDQLQFFTDHTERLKEEARKRIAAAGENGSVDEASAFFNTKRAGMPGVPNPENAFYFYNPTAVAYGKQEFKRVWGDRELADNWRSGAEKNIEKEISGPTLTEDFVFEEDPMFDPQMYLEKIPREPQVLDSLKRERNYAYFQLGVIYKEKFEDLLLAAEKLEALLEKDPEERLILPTKYNLHKIYSELGIPVKAEALKNDILFQYPNSRYAAILKNPGGLIKNENSPEALYEEVYALYENQEFEEVISQSEMLVQQLSGEKVVPKFELLKAMAIGRLEGFTAFKEALNYVALGYPQSAEGKRALEIYSEALPGLAKKEFENDSAANSFKLVFPLQKSTTEADTLQKNLQKVLGNINQKELKLSRDIYDEDQVFVVVHGFETTAEVKQFVEVFSNSEEKQLSKAFIPVSTTNYQVIQVHKTWAAYLEERQLTNDISEEDAEEML